MDISLLGSEEIIGGIVAILAAIYGVHKKLKSDSVETANQRAEINIIDALTKQRDDAISLSDSYREKLILTEKEIRDLKNKLDTIDLENLKLLQKLDKADSDLSVLKSIVDYLADTVSITRQTIENAENNQE